LLKITDPNGKPFPVLQLGDSSDLMIGEPTIAVGNPMGYSHSVSTGIVSAIHRDLKDTQDKVLLTDLIQTDAAINPGNSGGPLLNAYGQVIGINTAIRSDAQNIGFAIQVNKLRDLIPELMNPAQVSKVEVPLKLSEQRKLSPPANVACFVYDSAASRAPVSTIDGLGAADLVEAYVDLLKAKVGDTVTLKFTDGKSATVVAKAVPQPDAVLRAKQRLGITIEPLTPMLAEKYKLSEEDGMFVQEVVRGSVGAKAGLQPGDIIFQLGRYRVSSLQDFAALLDRLPESGRVRVGVVRGEQVGYGMLEF
jgi:S1-C subfamily serine protease